MDVQLKDRVLQLEKRVTVLANCIETLQATVREFHDRIRLLEKLPR